jgi:hypothetical protein
MDGGTVLVTEFKRFAETPRVHKGSQAVTESAGETRLTCWLLDRIHHCCTHVWIKTTAPSGIIEPIAVFKRGTALPLLVHRKN